MVRVVQRKSCLSMIYFNIFTKLLLTWRIRSLSIRSSLFPKYFSIFSYLKHTFVMFLFSISLNIFLKDKMLVHPLAFHVKKKKRTLKKNVMSDNILFSHKPHKYDKFFHIENRFNMARYILRILARSVQIF